MAVSDHARTSVATTPSPLPGNTTDPVKPKLTPPSTTTSPGHADGSSIVRISYCGSVLLRSATCASAPMRHFSSSLGIWLSGGLKSGTRSPSFPGILPFGRGTLPQPGGSSGPSGRPGGPEGNPGMGGGSPQPGPGPPMRGFIAPVAPGGGGRSTTTTHGAAQSQPAAA